MRKIYLPDLLTSTIKSKSLAFFISILFCFAFVPQKSFAQPADPASIIATAASDLQIDLSVIGNGTDNIVVIFNLTGTFTAPTPGIAPTAAGTVLAGSGGTIVYDGLASGLSNHTSLAANTQYFYKAFSYDALNNYSSGITDDATTCATAFTTSGGGSYCSGGTGVTITLSGSENGVSYQLKNSVGTVGSPIPGTGAALNFNNIMGAETYTIDAINSDASCTVPMSGNATITINSNVTPTVSISANPGNNICAGVSVTFTPTPVNGGLTPTYQWKLNGADIAGETNSTYNSSSLANGNKISLVLTSSALCPSPATATSNIITMGVNAVVIPTVSISASSTTICEGTSVTFTASPINGGAAPTYQWKVNGANVGTNSPTFTSTTLADGNNVSVDLTSNATCASPVTVSSNTETMVVNPVLVPSVTIVANPGNTICSGTSVTFTATPVNGGTPSYQWKVNGVNAGTNSATFTTTTLANGDNVTVDMTSDATCASPTTVSSNSIAMVVNPNLPVSVSIAANPGNVICAGTSVTFTATPTNGGASPSYQWQVNGVNAGTNSNTFTTTTLANNDVVKVILTSDAAPCATGNPATSNTITMVVNPTLVPSVSIAANPGNTICSGTSVTFTATPTNGGTSPSYQWKVNGVNAGTNSNTFTSATLANGDVVTVVLTSNAACASPATATSNSIAMVVNPNKPVTVTISANPATAICAGTSVTFTAVPTNGGAGPAYQWQVNGVNTGTNSSTFTSTTLANGDIVKVILTSNVTPCATGNPATSNTITMAVNQNATITLTSASSTAAQEVCRQSSITNITYSIGGGGTGATVSGLPTGVTGNFNVGIFTISGAPSSSVAAGTYSYTVNTTGPCLKPSLSGTIKVYVGNPGGWNGSDKISGPASVCPPAANLTYTIDPATNVQFYQWTVPAGFTITSGAGTNTITVSVNTSVSFGSKSISVAAVNPCNSSAPKSFNVNVNSFAGVNAGANQNVCTGGTVTLAGVWSGNTAASTWTASSGTFSNPTLTNSTYTPSITSGNITLTITTNDPAGVCTAASDQVVITVNRPPAITSQPVSPGTLCSGSNGAFSVTATGTGLTYQWRKGTTNLTNTGNISGATTATLTLTGVTTGDAGNYNVVVTGISPCSPVTSNDAALAVNQVVAITTQPVSPGTLCSGSNATFSVTATGTGLTYQWRKGTTNLTNTGNISGATTATLTLTGVSTADAGNYNVIVSGTNPCTPVTSSDAALVVNEVVAITAQPVSPGTLCSGSNATFNVTATGTGLTYQWRKGASNLTNTGNISGATTATLTLTGVSTSDAGNYNVIVSGTNPCSPVTSTDAVLAVNQVVAITVQPVSPGTLCSGSNATFNVTATGTGLTYQWRKGATNLTDGGNISGATTATLTLTGVSTADAGNYNVIVSGTNPCTPVTSSDATLGVNQVLAITSQPAASQTLCSGSNATFTVTATGTGLTYQWRKGATNLSNGGKISGATTATLTLTGVSTSDAGNYNVVVSGTSPCTPLTSNNGTLVVNQVVTITTQPSNISICESTTADFNVVATGTSLTYQWYKGIAPGGTAVTTSSSITGAQTANLHFNSAALADDGNYYVIVSGASPCADATSNQVTLNVDKGITISTQPSSQTLCEGADVTFSVVADANGDPLSYQWRKNGANIGGANSATYSINNITTANAGDYDVVISGPSGYMCSNAVSGKGTLTVNTAPAITTQPSAPAATCSGSGIQSISVVASGSNLTYSWRKGGVAVTNGGVISGQGTATLTLTNATTADAGSYDVVISGTCSPSVTSSAVTVTINTAPSIGTQPAAPAATCSGSGTQTISVVASGTNLTYSWRKGGVSVSNGGVISGQGSATLTLTNPTTANAGSYDVVVSGACTPAATSTAVTVTINTAPSITTQPAAPAATCSGSGTQTMSVVATGTGLTYSWRKGGVAVTNGGVISGQGIATLTLTNPTTADAGSYDVVISGTCTPAVTSSAVAVTINTAPAITTQPAVPAATCSGSGTQTMSVVATGTGLTYSWRKGGVAVTNGGVISGQGTATLTLTNPTTANAGSYDVIVSGTCTPAITSNAVAVAVNTAPSITTQPTVPAATCSGSGIQSMSVVATGTGLTYSWRKGGVAVVNGGVISGQGTATLTLTNGTTADAGSYDVVISGTCTPAVTSSAATVTINTAPSITTQPAAPAATCSGSGTQILSVVATGTGLTYSWRKGGVAVTNGGVISGQGTATLTLTNPTAANAGSYDVIITGTCAPAATSTAVTVTVDPTSVGGTLAAAVTTGLCSGSNGGTINLTGQTGSNLVWQFSLNAGTTWSPVTPANNTTSLTYTNLTTSRLYRVVVQSGSCATAVSSSAVVAVNPPFIPTVSVLPPATICLGQSATLAASSFSALGDISGGTFNNANPAGWSGDNANNSNGNDNSDWGEANGGKTYSGGVIYNNSNTPSGGKFMIVNGTTSQADRNSILSTPVFSMVGRTSALFDWWQAYNLTAGAVCKVEISIDGGTTWLPTPLATYTGVSGTPSTTSFIHTTVDLTNYLGQTNLKVRFNYFGTNGSNWALDDVNVTGSYQPVTISWSGSDGSSYTGDTLIVSPTDTTTYTVITSTGGCATTTTSITVNVADPVVITAQPLSTSFCIGSNASIGVSATGTLLAYQWQVSTTGIGGTYTNVANGAPYSGYSGITTATLNFTAPPITLSTNYYRVIINGIAACGPDTSNPAALRYSNVWTGTTSTDWNTGSNWSDGVVPSTSCPTVYIPNRTNQPTLSTGPDAVITNLVIDPNAILTITNSTVTRIKIGGTITNNGRLDVTTGSIEYNGASAQTIPANLFYTNKIKDLTISNNVTLNGVDSLTGVLSFGSTSKTFTTNDNLTLKSTAASTGAVDQIISGNSITGAVTVERYFGVKRAWRFLSVPTNTTQSVRQSWMENAVNSGDNPVPRYGTQVTNNNGTWDTDGFDYYSPDGPSVKRWDPDANAYISISSPSSQGVKTSEGWMTFVRGDRTAIGLYATPTTTTLRTKGTLYTGDQPANSVGAEHFQGINNPYASPLDMRNITKDAGINDFFYLWDPYLGSPAGLGAYQTFKKVGADYTITPGGGSYGASGSIYNYIQSGQAFFVAATFNTGGNLTLKESAKPNPALASSPLVFRSLSGKTQPSFITNLYAVESNGSLSLVDGVSNDFGDNYNNALDKFDAGKLTNISENFSIKTDNRLLAIERRHTINEKDTIHFNMLKMKVKSYRFEFIGKDFDPGVTAFLEDSNTNTRIPLDVNGNSTYNFNVVNVPGSWNPSRFRIVFESVGALPVTFSTVKAYPKEKDISVEWKVEDEKNISKYEVEKSTDGQHFVKSTTIAATGNTGSSVNYQWLDENAVTGSNYYRIKSIDINGKVQYSNIVKVAINTTIARIMVYPNPVTDGNINLKLINQPKGKYGIRLMNRLGQVIMVKQIEHEEGSSSQDLKVKLLAHGMYNLEVTKPDKSHTNINVFY